MNTLADKIGSLCSILPAVHALTVCDTTSKFGTKPAGLKVNPCMYLMEFANSSSHIKIELLYVQAEEYLIQVLTNESSAKSMDKFSQKHG